ncbi:hypothetical protein [Paenibacillus glufosinatiresistens]|uniref:hypothetical protein n=1 Tax=Paenibacillus glufosinatiresistens TaxID=3070657 RepID=UPI00286E8EFB|nr:hypothetical protein [Paenibacillus sp. YX.27]
MLKKLFSGGALMLLLLIMTCGSALAAPAVTDRTAQNREEALKIVERANQEIQGKIAAAVEQADRMQQDYVKAVTAIRQSQALAKLNELKVKYLTEGSAARKAQMAAEMAALEPQAANDNPQVDRVLADIDQKSRELIDTAFAQRGTVSLNARELTASFQNQSLQDLTASLVTLKYSNDLDKLIRNLYNETLAIADGAIAQAARLGVKAERYWELVTLGDRQVWIDPIAVSV